MEYIVYKKVVLLLVSALTGKEKHPLDAFKFLLEMLLDNTPYKIRNNEQEFTLCA